MKEHTTSTAIPTHALKAESLASMSASFERSPCRRGRGAERVMEQEASKGFRRLKAHKHLEALRAALVQRNAKAALAAHLVQTAKAA